MGEPSFVILGAGPAGVGAAYRLSQRGFSKVTVLERGRTVGGNAGSFDAHGMKVDFGSHRLHPSCEPDILKDIQTLLGGDLLERPRHGRIRLHRQWVHFPLKPLDLLFRISPAFAVGVGKDFLVKPFSRFSQAAQPETFASILEAGLGTTICREFYFPYARKIWGLEPEDLGVTQAKRRVGSSSLGKMVRKILTAVPLFKPDGTGKFFYPRLGFGQITEGFFRAAQSQGVRFVFESTVKTLKREGNMIHSVGFHHDDREENVVCDQVWSTLPVTGVVRGFHPSAPAELLESVSQLRYRAMILIYLVLKRNRFTEFDAHYFPEEHIRITRLSEPKNYSLFGPEGRTVLCAELPCAADGVEWNMTAAQLGELVRSDLQDASLPNIGSLEDVIVKRLRYAYPIYQRGYESPFEQLDTYLNQFHNLVSFGRQGLFAHDNTHHALFMAYRAVDCLEENGVFDYARWREFRKVFETHVVED